MSALSKAAQTRGTLASSGNLFLAASLSERAKICRPGSLTSTTGSGYDAFSFQVLGWISSTASTMQTSGGSTKSINGEPETDDRRENLVLVYLLN